MMKNDINMKYYLIFLFQLIAPSVSSVYAKAQVKM